MATQRVFAPAAKASLGHRFSVFVGLAVPGLGLPILAWMVTYAALTRNQTIEMAVGGVVLYFYSGFGITVGYHRLLTHNSFQVPLWLRRAFAVAGCSALQGPPVSWVADHRKHHQNSDKPGDPHSPHGHGTGWRNMLAGLWHAHTGWLFTETDAPPKVYAKELIEDPFMCKLEELRWYLLIALLSLFGVPALLGFLITGTAQGALFGVVWMGLVRAFWLLQFTFSINSACHVVGKRTFVTDDQSRDVWWLALPTLGEANHNGHHAFPFSFRHGLRGGIDLSAMLIQLLEWTGLASNLRGPDQERIELKRNQAA